MTGNDREAAESLAKENVLPKVRDEAIEEYLDTIHWQRSMSNDPIHKKMKATAKRLREEEDYELLEAWQYALEKRKYLLHKKIKQFKPIHDDSQ